MAPDRAHPREELIELLWPGVDLGVGRNRLRQVLSALKSQLERHADANAVLQADRMSVRVVPGTLQCDAREFERLLRAGDDLLARDAYGGELMPGHYEDWVIDERGRLQGLFERLEALPRLVLGQAGLHASAQGASVTESKNQAATVPGQLPHFWTRLYGLELNATRLWGLVQAQRLVTVLGPGGSGKTRLAVQAARALEQAAGQMPWGSGRGRDGDNEVGFARVVFVSLIDCLDEKQAIDAIALALGIRGRDALASVATAMAGQRALLVLDNMEQLTGLANAALLRLLTDTATLHLLVTSRQRLALDGEQVFELAGLALPPPSAMPHDGSSVGGDTLSNQPAVALFVDRARAARADFVLGAREEAAVVQLVHLLAGMPLAIELAASRMRSLTPQALLALLTHGNMPLLDVLARAGAGHSPVQRHASMRHVVDWSWRQLSPEQVALMQAMTTFAAPARIDTVAAVAGLNMSIALDRLEQLRDGSLVVAQPDHNDALRYVLLQPVREFVAERTEPTTTAMARARLRAWLTGFGQRCSQRLMLNLPDVVREVIQEVEAELAHIYAAIQSAAADGAHVQAAQVAAALRRHWEVDTRAGLPLSVTQALEAAQGELLDAGLRCEICVLLCFSRSLDGDVKEALAWGELALTLAPDKRLRAHALLRWAQVIVFSDNDQSAIDAPIAEALALAIEVGDLEAQALALRLQFVVLGNRDDDHYVAEQRALQVQTLWERLGHRRNAYGGLMDRASCWIEQGRHKEAATALAACEQVAREEGSATGYITTSWQLGRVSMRLRHADAALAAFRRCVHGAWQHLRLAYVADALVLAPGGLAMTGQLEEAARLQGFAVAHWQNQFGPFYRELERDVRFTRRLLFHRLGPRRLDVLRLEGSRMNLSEAVALALGGKTGLEPI